MFKSDNLLHFLSKKIEISIFFITTSLGMPFEAAPLPGEGAPPALSFVDLFLCL